MNSESVEFLSESHRIRGILISKESKTKIGVVVLHPHPLFGGDMENHVVRSLEGVFLEASFTTLRFNFRGTPSSHHGYSGIKGGITDTLNAIEFLKSKMNVNAVGIAGYSFGASIAFRTALIESPVFLISLSASTALISEDGFDIEQISKIECPVLMFHGKTDQMIPFSDLKILADKIKPEFRKSVSLEGEGHFYQRTLPLVVSSVREFIKNLFL